MINFRSWKQRLSLLTLLMACLFTAGWMRSLNRFEAVIIPCGQRSVIRFASSSGSFGVRFLESGDSESNSVQSSARSSTIWVSEPIYSSDDRRGWDYFGYDIHWQWIGWGFDIGQVSKSGLIRMKMSFLIIPYWFATTAFSLISVYLLFGKSRRSLAPTTPLLTVTDHKSA